MDITTSKTNGDRVTQLLKPEPHHLVWQLRKAREEWRIIFDGISDEDGYRRLGRMNSLGWMMAHLAWHENINHLLFTGETIVPDLDQISAKGGIATTPRLSEMKEIWETVVTTADAYLETLTLEDLLRKVEYKEGIFPEPIGAILQRVNNHYFYHIGEASAIRQLLEHTDFPEVMSVYGSVTYHPELR